MESERLQIFLSHAPESHQSDIYFADYALRCIQQGNEPDWSTIADEVSKARLAELQLGYH
ncbi:MULTISPECIES: hypothetical protein [Muribaculaceae]|uniref:hypothetical protein n=1 Tax=Muribaculaceae TaxID=2005473 RepID=UPI00264A2D05|nr:MULTISPECIES: hypothetical protein [Muribaculaceae]